MRIHIGFLNVANKNLRQNKNNVWMKTVFSIF